MKAEAGPDTKNCLMLRKKYAGCDYMIDVMVDEKTTVFFFFKFSSYSMRGTAIQYNKQSRISHKTL